MNSGNKLMNIFSGVIPWIYLIYITCFFLLVGIRQNALPQYGSPDPKSYPFLHFIEIILMLLVPASFLFWAFSTFYMIIKRKWTHTKFIIVGLTGYLVIFLLVQMDPVGIMVWLAD